MCAWRVFSATLALCLAACGSSNSSSPPSEVGTGSTINQPTVINLYPHESAGGTDPLITVMVTSVGNVPVSMSLGFDTGSSGVTLYAQSIFPASMVNDSGFVFPAGETSMSYNGITVTNVQGTRTYGNESTLVETGNLGFATVTFGDSAGQITTQVMPVFFFYSLSYTSADIGSGYFPPMWQGWFGVAGTRQPINVAGSVAPAGGFGGCTQQTTTTCLMVSPLKFIDYGNQVNAGFSLSPSPTFPICDISTSGSCAPQPLLTISIWMQRRLESRRLESEPQDSLTCETRVALLIQQITQKRSCWGSIGEHSTSQESTSVRHEQPSRLPETNYRRPV
jgi:hypothetical protein